MLKHPCEILNTINNVLKDIIIMKIKSGMTEYLLIDLNMSGIRDS